MLEQLQPWMDYKKLVEQQAKEESYIVRPEEQKVKTKNKPYKSQTVQVLKLGRK